MALIEVRGAVDPRAVEQLELCASFGNHATRAAICADGHVGYSQPIGGVIAYPDHVSVSGVGYDIGCGNKAVRTDVRTDDASDDVAGIMDTIAERISFGVGRPNREPIDHPVLDAIREAPFDGQRGLLDRAAAQLGTVGAGNHFVDLFDGDDGYLWVGVHFGSRGFGHATASGFLSLAQGGSFTDRAPDGEMDAPPTLLEADTALGQAYISAMELAGDYARAGRDVVVDRVLDILGANATYTVHNHHNYAWREHHDGQDVWVVRKGATPAWPGQEGFVGATMGEASVILRGTDAPEGAGLLRSTVHGAGRAMSRRKAAGKRRKRLSCMNRDCAWTQPPRTSAPDACPSCGNTKLRRRWVQETSGAIHWPSASLDVRARGVELRGGAADEAPGAYKRLDDVLRYHLPTIEVVHRLRPVGVAMAGANVHDPYKD